MIRDFLNIPVSGDGANADGSNTIIGGATKNGANRIDSEASET
jgi:hypothetical protein